MDQALGQHSESYQIAFSQLEHQTDKQLDEDSMRVEVAFEAR